MTSPSDSNQGRFYSKRVGDKLLEYVWIQRDDLVASLLEASRLSRTIFNRATSGTNPGGLFEDWAELWSASVHYSAASLANLGALIAGLGYEIKKGKTDDEYPHRIIEFDRVLTGSPRYVNCWLIGEGNWQDARLPADKVIVLQSTPNMGTSRWDVVFDLSGDPPGDRKSGTYCLEVSIGEGVRDTVVEYFFLDPHLSAT